MYTMVISNDWLTDWLLLNTNFSSISAIVVLIFNDNTD